MAGDKITVGFEIQADAEKMLEYAASRYGLRDKHKALRCLLDYLEKDADWDKVFKAIRCRRCGNKGGWQPPS